MVRTGSQYSSCTVAFSVESNANAVAVLNITPAADASGAVGSPTSIIHLVLPDDTVENIVQALAGLVNNGTNLVWAQASGNQLQITARAMGRAGDGIGISLDASSRGVTITPAADMTSKGVDGAAYELDTSSTLNQTLIATADYWKTDLTATPRMNRAARDWHSAYFAALANAGLDVVTSFSTELLNVDPSLEAGMAQRYPDGFPVVLNTPAVQTNFSSQAIEFWGQVYLDMARLQSGAGLTPYLQFGEVQWWYLPKQVWDSQSERNVDAGMPFYDQYTKDEFQNRYGKPISLIASNVTDPSGFPDESVFLPSLIGAYTSAIREKVAVEFPGCRWEVLYPTDTNNYPLTRAINYASADWTPANLTSLKTESFGFTYARNLDLSTYSIGVSAAKGFAPGARSHLIGIGDSRTAWMKEADLACSQGLECVTLFALDQFCFIGYSTPPFVRFARSSRLG